MAKLRTYPARPWPRTAGWLVPAGPNANCSPLGFSIVHRWKRDSGTLERPLGSNWGGRVKTMIQRFGFRKPLKWCGFQVGVCWIDCNALVPDQFWDCDAWADHMVPLESVNAIDLPGAALLYGKPGDLYHIEIITRYEMTPDPVLMTGGGNRGYAGAPTNDGAGSFEYPTWRHDIRGVVIPQLAFGMSVVDPFAQPEV